MRDYTPAVLPTEAESGCAAAFLRFLTGTFWPDLARRVPVREDVRGVAGHSLSSLWWVDRAILCDAQNLQRKGVALPAKLFPSLGEEDRESMTGDLTLLEDQLAELLFPELEVSTRRFPGRNHFNVLPAACAVGLRALFTAEPPIPSLSFK